MGFIVFIHELAHFIVAKFFKVFIKDFSLGFGPKIFKKNYKGTEYSIGIIPLGGYVNMEGEETESDQMGSFSSLHFIKKILIVSAGGIANIVFGIIVYFIIMFSNQTNISLEINQVYPNTPAAETNIIANDKIVKVNNKKVRIFSDFNNIMENIVEEKVVIGYKRGNEYFEDEITPVLIETEETKKYVIGIELKFSNNSFNDRMYYAYWGTIDYIKNVFEGTKKIFTEKNKIDNFAGPVGVAKVIVNTEGIIDYIYLISIISLSVGVTNLLPFPPLDGGKNLIYLIEGIRKKKISEKAETIINNIGFLLLMVLVVVVTYNDIFKK